MIGQLPQYSPILLPDIGECNISKQCLSQWLYLLHRLEDFHENLLKKGFSPPRETWETWVTNAPLNNCTDVAFMYLLIIIMSSSTSDAQLANFVPKLFAMGFTCSRLVLEICAIYRIDCLCSLFSESGWFYQNIERIVNASDYFMQRHNGIIPHNISVLELASLHSVGYKTANIVITSAFHCVKGIPSDIHVLRWSQALAWCNTNTMDGLKCSHELERWLPKDQWTKINQIFGSLGQLISCPKEKEYGKEDLRLEIKCYGDPDVSKSF